MKHLLLLALLLIACKKENTLLIINSSINANVTTTPIVKCSETYPPSLSQRTIKSGVSKIIFGDSLHIKGGPLYIKFLRVWTYAEQTCNLKDGVLRVNNKIFPVQQPELYAGTEAFVYDFSTKPIKLSNGWNYMRLQATPTRPPEDVGDVVFVIRIYTDYYDGLSPDIIITDSLGTPVKITSPLIFPFIQTGKQFVKYYK